MWFHTHFNFLWIQYNFSLFCRHNLLRSELLGLWAWQCTLWIIILVHQGLAISSCIMVRAPQVWSHPNLQGLDSSINLFQDFNPVLLQTSWCRITNSRDKGNSGSGWVLGEVAHTSSSRYFSNGLFKLSFFLSIFSFYFLFYFHFPWECYPLTNILYTWPSNGWLSGGRY